MSMSRESPDGTCGLAFGAYKRTSFDNPETLAKELTAGQSDMGCHHEMSILHYSQLRNRLGKNPEALCP